MLIFRCFLMYSGIRTYSEGFVHSAFLTHCQFHITDYDAVSFTFADEGDRMKPSKNTAFHQTQFSKTESSKLMSAASELAKRRREKGQFTNTSTFDLKCLVRVYFLACHLRRMLRINLQVCGTGMKGEK